MPENGQIGWGPVTAGEGRQLHIVAVLAGIAGATLLVVLAAWAAGLSGWTVFGLGVGTLLLGQGLYLVWIAAMAAAEARRRRPPAEAAPETPARSGKGNVAQ